jgi:hypothetical protein
VEARARFRKKLRPLGIDLVSSQPCEPFLRRLGEPYISRIFK